MNIFQDWCLSLSKNSYELGMDEFCSASLVLDISSDLSNAMKLPVVRLDHQGLWWWRVMFIKCNSDVMGTIRRHDITIPNLN